MAAEESFLGDGGGRALAALLFLAAGTNAMDVYSATNSSPWTAENFGGDPEKVASLREYVCHALVITSGYGIVSALIAGSWWPIVGTIFGDGYMYWLYERAIHRGMDSGSNGWANQ